MLLYLHTNNNNACWMCEILRMRKRKYTVKSQTIQYTQKLSRKTVCRDKPWTKKLK